MLRHLASLSWSFPADGSRIQAISVYAAPTRTPHGVVYRPRIAAERGMEGVACVDDVARASILATQVYEREGDATAAVLAGRWMRFVHFMQLADGRVTNFILDRRGHRNLTGATSFAGGAWWTARALWAWAVVYRAFGSCRALDALLRCPVPAPETPGELKTRAVLVLAGVNILRSQAPREMRERWRRYIRYWCDAMVYAAQAQPYVPDQPGEAIVQMWGYHQLHALAEAGAELRDPAYLDTAERTVAELVAPVLADNFYYAYPTERAHQCAYCIAPLAQGLAALYHATGQAHYRALALQTVAWFAGANDARAVMYDPSTGRCWDGLDGARVSRHCGAESAIEAGFAELVRRELKDANGSAEYAASSSSDLVHASA